MKRLLRDSILGLALAVGLSTTAKAQWTEEQKLLGQTTATLDEFGVSVSISGSTAIVGAHRDTELGPSSGSAFIFEKDLGGMDNWGQLIKLTAADSSNYFGVSVSISGSTAIVGARFDDENGGSSGAAYIFEKDHGGSNNWGQLAKLTAADAAEGDSFGYSVCISGSTAIVGARWDDDHGSNAGSAYIFEKDRGGTNNWGQLTKLTAADGATDDEFGVSVAISGSRAIVGAHLATVLGVRTGSAYIFEKDHGGSNNWGQLDRLTANDGEAVDHFGYSVSVSGSTAIVGAHLDDDNGFASGSAYIFEQDLGGSDDWGQITKLYPLEAAAQDQFGITVSISGSTAIIGGPNDDDNGPQSGSAYIFVKDLGGTNNWGQLAELAASDAANADNFGYSASVSGCTAIVGAYRNDDNGVNSGSAYIFKNADYEPPTVSITVEDESCTGNADGSITVDLSGGTGTFTYSLDGGEPQASNVFSGLAAASYTIDVVVDGSSVCMATEYRTVGVNTTDSDLDGNPDCSDDCDLAVDGITNFNTTTCSCDPNFLPVIILIGSDEVITGCEITTSLDDLNSVLSDDAERVLFPNPNRGDQLFISLTEVGAEVNTVTVDIYDLTGKRVSARTIQIQDGFVNSAMDAHSIANGLYMVHITAGEKTFTERLVIQK